MPRKSGSKLARFKTERKWKPYRIEKCEVCGASFLLGPADQVLVPKRFQKRCPVHAFIGPLTRKGKRES